jgi:hypothetical protein
MRVNVLLCKGEIIGDNILVNSKKLIFGKITASVTITTQHCTLLGKENKDKHYICIRLN